jgi:hypothetical protein
LAEEMNKSRGLSAVDIYRREKLEGHVMEAAIIVFQEEKIQAA